MIILLLIVVVNVGSVYIVLGDFSYSLSLLFSR